MKTISLMPKGMFGAIAFAIATTGLLVFAGCEKSDCDEDATTNVGAKPISKINVVIPFYVEGANMEWWANLTDNDVIYEERLHNQILAPDRHAVTWGEFTGATGTAKINCTGQGTRISITMEGLIPFGVYSMWLLKFDAPGFDTAYTHVSGFGAAGDLDGSENTFTASSDGGARFHVACPAGPLSGFGSIGGCVPIDEFELHFVGVYHLDGQTHGITPGPAGSYVEHFGFIVLNH